MVELMGPLSNPSSALLSLLRGTIDPTPGLMTTRQLGTSAPAQKQRRLEQATREELVTRYQAGDLMTELAERYGIHRRTVSAILKRHGIPTRTTGLSTEQVQRAVLLYAQGQSLAKIGKAFGVDAGTVHARLREQGIRMRNTYE